MNLHDAELVAHIVSRAQNVVELTGYLNNEFPEFAWHIDKPKLYPDNEGEPQHRYWASEITRVTAEAHPDDALHVARIAS